jgi:hypothetical protein
MIEKSNRLGGAWAISDALGLKNIETTPHVFLPYNATYGFLDSLIDSQFEPLAIQPVLSVRPRYRVFPRKEVLIADTKSYVRWYSIANVMNSSLARPGKLFKKVTRLASHLREHSNASATIQSVCYPRGGLVGFFERAERRLFELNATLLKEERVDQVVSKDGIGDVHLRSGKVVTGEKIWLTQHVDLPNVNAINGSIQIKRRSSFSNHYFYRMKSRPAGFRQFTAPFPVMFANDVTDYCITENQLDPGERVFSARTKAGVQFQPEEVIRILKFEGYLNAEAELLQSHLETREVRKVLPDCVAEIKNRLSPQVNFLLADDLGLMKSIADNCQNSA